MSEERWEKIQGSFNIATDLNHSLNSATSLAQTVSQPITSSGSTTTTATSSSAGASDAGRSNKS